MNKIIFSTILFSLSSLPSFSQLEVYSSGKVSAVSETEFPYANFLAGNQYNANMFSNYNIDISAAHTSVSNKFNIGLYANSTGSTSLTGGRSIGVCGIAGNTTSGYNYGVMGVLTTSQNGAGIYGATSGTTGELVPGQYAGYFCGPVRSTGNMMATAFVTPSDIRLKQDVTLLSEQEEDAVTLGKVMNMNVIAYNYRDLPTAETDDTATVEKLDTEKLSQQRHFGLSAQELQKLYPDLVVKGQDGYLGINYVELVPILIRSIQELKQQLDEVKSGKNEEPVNARRTQLDFDEEETANANGATAITAATLYQNAPNPFTERTTIRFTLPDDVQNAYIYVFDMQGKILKQIPIDTSMQSVTINGYELQAGMYIYSLVINGKEIQSRRMILSK